MAQRRGGRALLRSARDAVDQVSDAMMPIRRRLPNRRPAMTEEIAIDGGAAPFTATIGFFPDGRPAEVFLSGGKAGSTLATILGDAAVLISIALQHGIGIRPGSGGC